MTDDLLILHDQHGNLITNARRSKNRLYKVRMEIANTECLQTIVQNDLARWHARLGHIGVDAMKLMILKE